MNRLLSIAVGFLLVGSAFAAAYSNINATESLGSTVNTGLKGGAQLGALTVDNLLGPEMSFIALLVAFIIVAFANVMLVQANIALKEAGKVL